jgi:hypothetical protein
LELRSFAFNKVQSFEEKQKKLGVLPQKHGRKAIFGYLRDLRPEIGSYFKRGKMLTKTR